MTGTLLEVAQGVQVALDEHARVFEIRPKGFVVLVSACWGGYPSVLRALQSGEHTERPLVVAPLVRVNALHANALQAEILDAMRGEVDLDAAVERVALARDTALAPSYGESAFRVVRRNGEMVPAQGEAGLAAEMERPATYRVLAVEWVPTAPREPPGIAIVQGQDGRYWRVNVPALSNAATDDAVYELVGKNFRFRAKALRYNFDLKLGELVEVTDVESRDRHPLPPNPPPYGHAGQHSVAKTEANARPIPSESLERCKRCNWSSIRFASVQRGGVEEHDVLAVCHRDECPEHANWLAVEGVEVN
jgi:hypothetical protein